MLGISIMQKQKVIFKCAIIIIYVHVYKNNLIYCGNIFVLIAQPQSGIS